MQIIALGIVSGVRNRERACPAKVGNNLFGNRVRLLLMKDGKINAVIVGADRIAANGDTANKIGTYSLSVLAKAHNIPFYVAAPSSTFDLKLKTGRQIPIEQRLPDEVLNFMNVRTAPQDINVYNPAFDVTPAENISAIITENGIIQPPTEEKIRKIIGQV